MTKECFLATLIWMDQPCEVAVGLMSKTGETWNVWLLAYHAPVTRRSTRQPRRWLADAASERVANKYAAKYRRWLAEFERQEAVGGEDDV